MNIEKLITELGKNIGKTLMKKKEGSTEVINLKDATSSDLLPIILKGLILKKSYNKAENILFQELKNNTSQENYKIALDFYDSLMEKSEEELNQGDFSKEEVFQGLKDLELLFNKKA
ncbi:DUF6483 family protein [Clostridium polynesiense]|uniref:DUF6483 family protein n=1 Tax=Clostridium polynesiense TaxID=1325933 RepID=UPI00058FA345|nr:DUF6483 family protein [Clostridium polynesiense]